MWLPSFSRDSCLDAGHVYHVIALCYVQQLNLATSELVQGWVALPMLRTRQIWLRGQHPPRISPDANLEFPCMAYLSNGTLCWHSYFYAGLQRLGPLCWLVRMTEEATSRQLTAIKQPGHGEGDTEKQATMKNGTDLFHGSTSGETDKISMAFRDNLTLQPSTSYPRTTTFIRHRCWTGECSHPHWGYKKSPSNWGVEPLSDSSDVAHIS